MFSPSDLQAIFLTIKLAFTTTLLLLLFGTPLAWWLSQTKSKIKIFIEPLVSLPLVLPPTVLGFYLLLFLGNNGPIAKLFNIKLVFSFQGLVIGSLIYSLPFVIQPIQNAFTSIGRTPFEVASTLGANSFQRFISIAIPLAKPGFMTAAILGFSHTLGEFGVVLMLGGNIPGKTQVLSIAIYDHVESFNYHSAHLLSGGLLIFSFLTLLSVSYLSTHVFKQKQSTTAFTQ